MGRWSWMHDSVRESEFIQGLPRWILVMPFIIYLAIVIFIVIRKKNKK